MIAHIHRIIIFPPRFVIAVKMGLFFLLQNGKQCLDRCRERNSYNYNISYYREKIYGIYRTCRSFDDKAITMRKLLYWCPICCLPDEVEAKVLLSQLRVQPMRIHVYPAGLRGTDTVPKIEKRILQSSLTGRLDCSFFVLTANFTKSVSMLKSCKKWRVPTFRCSTVFLRHKNFVCHIPIRVLCIWWDSNKLRSRRHAGKREMLDKAPLIC